MYTGDEVLVVCTGDWQLDPILRGAPRSADVARLRKVIQWGIDHEAWFLGTGDYADSMSPSNRAAWAAAKLYDSPRLVMENGAEDTLEEIKENLVGTEGRWLGMVSGHHFHPFQDGSTTDTRLTAHLGTPHLGDMGIVHLLMPRNGHKRQPMAKIWVAHGSGNGKAGAALSKVENTGMRITDQADAYVMGHMHKVEATKVQRIGTMGGERGGQPRMTSRDIALACTGSMLRGYTEGSKVGNIAQGSYVERAMMSPSALGAAVLSFKPVITRHGYTRLDIDAATI